MSNNIEFKLLGDAKDLEKTLSNAKKNFESFGKASALAFVGMTASAYSFIEAARQQELSVNALNLALKNQGNYTDEASKDLLKYADSLAKISLFEDDQIIKAQSLIAAFGIEGDKLKELTRVTLDLAQAKGMDLASAADMVAKAVGTSTNALGRYGIQLDSVIGVSARAEAVIKGIDKLYRGQAEAATEGLGATELLKKELGELAEDIGTALAPSVISLSKNLREMIENIRAYPEVAKMAAETLKWGIIVTGSVAGIMALSSAVGGLITVANGLTATLILLSANPAFLVIGGLALAAGHAAYATYDLANAWKKTNEELDKQIAYQNKVSSYYRLGDENAFADLGRIEVIKKVNQAEIDEATRKAAAIKNVEEDLEILKAGMQSISALRTQVEVDEYIDGINEKRTAEIEYWDMVRQLYENNGAMTAEKQEEIRNNIATINAKYDGLEVLAAQERQVKLSNLEQKGLEISRKVNADKVASLSTTLQQAANLNSKFANAYKAVAIGEAIMSTAAGVARALKDYPFPANIAIGALVAAAGAVQIATIAAQSFAVGTPYVPQDMVANVHQGETIIPATFADAIRAGDLTLSGGGSVNNDNGVTVEISNCSFNGITETFVRELFAKAGEAINNRTLSPLPAM